MSRTFLTDDVVTLVDALDRIADDLATMTGVAEREATRHAYVLYYRFRRKLRDADTLSAILEERLNHLQEGRSAGLDDRKKEIMARLMTFEARGLLKFTYVLSANTFLPIGSKEIFSYDLQRLAPIKDRLENCSFTDDSGEEALANLAIVRDILTEMAQKAPSIDNFGAAPEAA